MIKIYGKHTVYSDSGTRYPEACSYLSLKHRLHSSLEKSIIERTIEYFKDRTEHFDDYYYPCKRTIEYDFTHVNNWLDLFVYIYKHNNADILHIKFMDLVQLMRGERKLNLRVVKPEMIKALPVLTIPLLILLGATPSAVLAHSDSRVLTVTGTRFS